ncbi:MAG: F0F1 ATP synthase subunit alpha [bacterium]|nr:F0F1 ATP synthase subunit alpha [bacterium]
MNLSESIINDLKNLEFNSETQNVGEVLTVGDGIAEVSGLGSVGSSELVYFEKADVYGMALNIENLKVGVVIMGNETKIKEGDKVIATNKVLEIPVGKEMLGRTVNALGQAIDGEAEIQSSVNYPVERKAPGVIYRKSVNRPLQTGIKMIDAIVPVGRGQRELIIGDRQTGKTAVGIDIIISQANQNNRIEKGEIEGKLVYCVYVAVGQKASKVALIKEKLKEVDALKWTTIVYASPDETAAMQYIAPYTGTAVGEWFMDNAMDAVIIYDDLTKQAWAYRQMALLLRRPPGREAYPGDVFYLHSRLLERSAQLSDEKGGGSLTAFPIIETQEGDVSAYIPTNVISITDGQIYLDADLFFSGMRPAVNAGTSVSRVGGSAQIKAMKQVAGKMRLDLAQYRELAAFSQFGSDLDKDTQDKLARGATVTQLLKQDQYTPLPVEEQIISIYAGVNGYLDNIQQQDIKIWESNFLSFIRATKKESILQAIVKEGKITEEIEAEIKNVLENFSL